LVISRRCDVVGHKIPAIENLGVARAQDAIDFTDNDISSLSNFPHSPRLRTLLLARNRVSHIQPSIASSLPNLTTLILTANRMSELADLEPLKNLLKLTHLSLLENPVARKDNYRHWVIWLLPTVRFLDYQKVKDVERSQANNLFGTRTQPSALASKMMGIKSRAFDISSTTSPSVGAGASGRATLAPQASERGIRVKLTEMERKRVEKMIREAKSLQEIAKLEKELNEGRIPGGAMGDYDDDEDEQMKS